MKKHKVDFPKNTDHIAAEELQENIRRRAYELYEQRGSEHGRDLDDWIAAEKEIVVRPNQD